MIELYDPMSKMGFCPLTKENCKGNKYEWWTGNECAIKKITYDIEEVDQKIDSLNTTINRVKPLIKIMYEYINSKM